MFCLKWQKKKWDQLLKYGKIPFLTVWLMAVMCFVCVSWEFTDITFNGDNPTKTRASTECLLYNGCDRLP